MSGVESLGCPLRIREFHIEERVFGKDGCLKMLVPENAEEQLALLYGRNWRTPDPYHCHYDEDNNKIYEDVFDCDVAYFDAGQVRQLLEGNI